MVRECSCKVLASLLPLASSGPSPGKRTEIKERQTLRVVFTWTKASVSSLFSPRSLLFAVLAQFVLELLSAALP